MTLTQLRCLVAIVDANRNMSVAAMRMGATQPGLSRQLRQIEDELGFQIFVRRGKALDRVTANGTALIERARAILGEVRNIDVLAANHRGDTRGTLRIAATQALSRFVLPPALDQLRARFDEVRFRLRPGDEDECLAMLARDEIDLGLVSTEGERPPCAVAIPLFRWERALIVPRNHVLVTAALPLTLEMIAEHPIIAAESATNPQTKLGRAFHAQNLTPDIVCTARDADSIKTFVRRGFGVGLVAEMALTQDDDDLADLDGRGLFPRCITWAILRPDRIQRDYVFELLRTLAPTLSGDSIDRMIGGMSDPESAAYIPSWDALRPRWEGSSRTRA